MSNRGGIFKESIVDIHLRLERTFASRKPKVS
jgi:hypothetical protein